MSRVCQFCGRRTEVGNQIARRGLAKKKGGIGLKTTGITKRQFKPNIQWVRAAVGGHIERVRVCARCIKSGRISKTLPRGKTAATAAPA